MLKDLLTIVQGGPQNEQAVASAIAFARLHDAHLTLAVLTEDIQLATTLDPLGCYWPEPNSRSEHRGNLSAVRAQIDRAGIPANVHGACMEPPALPAFARADGRCVDLVMVPGSGSWSDQRLRRHVIESLLTGGSAPTLLTPDAWSPVAIRRAVLGWDASVQAARAARALFQFVEPGARIDILVVDAQAGTEIHGSSPGSGIARHLAHHGFDTEVHLRASDGRSVAETLEGFAASHGADLLVTGAFAHSRFREILLGGTTRELIEHARLPVLMLH